MKTNIYGLTKDTLTKVVLKLGGKAYNSTQIYEWLYKKKVTNFQEMTNLSKQLIVNLEQHFIISSLGIVNKYQDGETSKYLLNLSDGLKIEAVLLKQNYGTSICVSSQVGCNFGCQFCQSGRLKKVRNLETSELVSQILLIETEEKIRITNVVIMGIGEPFDNYDNILDFIRIITDNKGLDIGIRHITVSTVGLVPKINEFKKFELRVNLAISLHASNDKLRSELMPINRTYNLSSLLQTVQEYIKVTRRRVTFEYILLKDINDSEKNALELAKLLKGINCYVNLIPYNETKNIEYKISLKNQILKFYDILKKNNINVVIRQELGKNIKAACGQLSSNEEEHENIFFN